MDSKITKATPSAVTPQKLVLIGVLAVVLLGILYLQFGRSGGAKSAASTKPAAREKSAARPAPPPTKADETVRTGNLRRAMNSLSHWQPPDLAAVAQYDPFALPASFPQPAPPNSTGTLAEQGETTPEALKKEQLALAKERQQMQQELETLRHQGVHVLVTGHGESVAVVGDQVIRVGDEINGFKVISINSDGVQVAWEGN